MTEGVESPETVMSDAAVPEPQPPRYRLTGVTAVCCAVAHGWRVHRHRNRWTGPQTRIDWDLAVRLLDEDPHAIYLDVLIEGLPDWVDRPRAPTGG
jgi:hypothetical protein